MFNEIDSSMTIGEQPGSLDRSKRLFFCIEALPKITPLRNHLILDSDYVAALIFVWLSFARKKSFVDFLLFDRKVSAQG